MRDKTSFGEVVVGALRGQMRRNGSSVPVPLGRLLENPTTLRRVAAELRDAKPLFVNAHIPTYHWREAVASYGDVHGSRDLSRFAPSACAPRTRLHGPCDVRLTFVCFARPVTYQEARQGILDRQLEPAHPIEGLALVQLRPDLLYGPAPITVVGRTLGPARSLPLEDAKNFPRTLLTFWSAGGRPTTYLEPVEERLPAHHLFLATLR